MFNYSRLFYIDHPATISDRMFIEAVALQNFFSKDESDMEKEMSSFEDKNVEYYCLRCYETSTLALMPMQEHLFKLEQQLAMMDSLLNKVHTSRL